MSDRYFLDTNIFVYSFDTRQPTKQRKSWALIEQALSGHSGVISSQVVQEFLNVAFRKFEKPFSSIEARTYLDQVLGPLCDLFPSVTIYRKALDLHDDTGFSFYDSLIVSAAIHGGCKTLYTEDLHHGQRIEGVTIQNPFA